MAIKESYKIGQNVVSEEGILLGQYVEDKKQFIVRDVAFLKETMLKSEPYSIAKDQDNNKYQIYGKRKIFNEKFGSLDQFLVKTENDLEWKQLSDNVYHFIDLDY